MPKRDQDDDKDKEKKPKDDQKDDKDEKRDASSPDPDEEEREKDDDDKDSKDKNDKDDKERSVELVFSTGAGVVRRDESGNEYLEVLSLDPGAVDLSRLNSGAAPLLNSHARDGLGNILGVVSKAWIDPRTNQGVASVRFSRRPDVDPIFRDVKDKIIVSTSVGYSVNRWEDITKPGDEMQVRLVTSWTPHEISLVGIPADPNSKVRKKFNQRIEMRVMANKDIQTTDLITQERKRGVDIRRAAKAALLADTFADDLIERGISMSEASEIIITEMTRAKTNYTPIIGHHSVQPGSLDEVETRKRGIENALLHKMAPQAYKLEEFGKRYVGSRLVDYAQMSMRGYAGISDREFYNNPMDTFIRAFNGGTSDFPAILANVLNKELRRGFESAPATWQAFCRKTNVNNLKPIQRPQLGEAPLMEKVNEHGEYRRGGISETNQTYSLDEYGKIMSLPLRVLLDDDMNAFSRIPTLMGSAASDFMSETFYNLLGNNPKLRNGDTYSPLFDSTHSNVADGGADLSIDSLSLARTAFRQQKGQAGRVLNLLPKYLLLPSTLETKADQFLSQNLLVGQIASATSPQGVSLSGYNPFANKLTPIVEPRLDRFSKTAWYLVADLERIDICEVAYLNGMETPMIISRDGFSSSGVEWRINHFFGFGFIEHRSWFMFPKMKGEK